MTRPPHWELLEMTAMRIWLSAVALMVALGGVARAQEDPAPVVTGDLFTVSSASDLSFGGVGYAGTLTEAYQAYTRLADSPADAAALDWIAQHGTPAGRIYAGLLLWQQDEAAGRAALTSLLAQTDEMTTISGCMLMSETLGAVAAQYLASGPPVLYSR